MYLIFLLKIIMAYQRLFSLSGLTQESQDISVLRITFYACLNVHANWLMTTRLEFQILDTAYMKLIHQILTQYFQSTEYFKIISIIYSIA